MHVSCIYSSMHAAYTPHAYVYKIKGIDYVYSSIKKLLSAYNMNMQLHIICKWLHILCRISCQKIFIEYAAYCHIPSYK